MNIKKMMKINRNTYSIAFFVLFNILYVSAQEITTDRTTLNSTMERYPV